MVISYHKKYGAEDSTVINTAGTLEYVTTYLDELFFAELRCEFTFIALINKKVTPTSTYLNVFIPRVLRFLAMILWGLFYLDLTLCLTRIKRGMTLL